jgi:hypothetical protein
MRAACTSLLSSAGLQEPPIPLKPLLEKLGIKVQRVRSKKPRGVKPPQALLAAKGSGLVAFLYEDDLKSQWRRGRFTLAHEIGHALLIHTLRHPALIASLEASPESHRQVEKLCNLAASEILMPTRAVRKALREHDFSPKGLISLYDRFLVSREVLVRRLAAVVPHTSAVRWKVFSRSTDETRQMRVIGSYPGYNRVSTRPWLPSGCTTKHLDPPIVDWAILRGEAILESDLRISLGARQQECVAIATFFPLMRSGEQQPSFEGLSVPDEQVRSQEIILFAADKLMAGDACAWELKNKNG